MTPKSATPLVHLFEGFERSVREHPHRPALEIGSETHSYSALARFAKRLAAIIRAGEAEPRPLAAFLAYRSTAAYVSVLGILAAGKGYVPLNPNFPVERSRKMLQHSGVNVLVVGRKETASLVPLLSDLDRPLTVICEDRSAIDGLSAACPRHTFVEWTVDGEAPAGDETPRIGPESIAYLLFTSGSTGVPKGVAVSQRNVTAYIAYVSERYAVGPEDRFSQTFDMTFDLSVHDMFLCWTNGGCLCCLPQRALMGPAKFIRDKRLTMWFSVPSVVQFMERMRMLKPGAFPGLRVSLFCGEALLAASAEAWRKAAPASRVENLYGPTEATIAISHYAWEDPKQAESCVNGVVPIGSIFPTQGFCVIDAEQKPVARGESGELCLCGSQVTGGYFNNPDKTREQFVTIDGRGEATHYRTGDLACEDADGCLHYLGRIDNQVQIRGHRVELQEIEHVMRAFPDAGQAVAVAWPGGQATAESIYAFRCGGTIDTQELKRHCEKQLPEYMVPREIFTIGRMPLNVNGKVDRRALGQRIEETIRGRD